MRRHILLAALLLAGCAGGAESSAAAGGCASNQVAFQRLVGGSLDAARATLAAMPGIRTVRVGEPGTPMTRDFRPDRATVIAEGNVVRSITCG